MTRMPSFSLDYYNKAVIQRIIDKYKMEPMDATRAFLTSEIHRMLEDADLAMWEFSERAVFDMWEAEKTTGDPHNSESNMTEEMLFFLFLIERYAGSHGRFTGDVLAEWDKKGITKEVYDGYWEYHQEALQNAYNDIDSLLTTGKHAW